jgi:hypothetical protein
VGDVDPTPAARTSAVLCKIDRILIQPCLFAVVAHIDYVLLLRRNLLVHDPDDVQLVINEGCAESPFMEQQWKMFSDYVGELRIGALEIIAIHGISLQNLEQAFGVRPGDTDILPTIKSFHRLLRRQSFELGNKILLRNLADF